MLFSFFNEMQSKPDRQNKNLRLHRIAKEIA